MCGEEVDPGLLSAADVAYVALRGAGAGVGVPRLRPSQTLQLPDGLVDPRRVAADKADVGSVGGEAPCDGEADALVGARDDAFLACQRKHDVGMSGGPRILHVLPFAWGMWMFRLSPAI